jgi:UDP-galactopyranose mutase
MSESPYILVVGAGLSGATIADQCARRGARVKVIERRDHIGGNVYDEIDAETGIRVSRYGAHLFHTNDAEVWNYVNQFGEWVRWEHEVVADVSGTLVPVPVNCTTVNLLCGTAIQSEAEMREWLAAEQVPCASPKNSEEIALARVGTGLYERLFKPYTWKQWAKEPAELEPEVLARIPVRPNFDPRYFTDKFQALPKFGYTEIVRKMLDHPNISVELGKSWENFLESAELRPDQIVFTGPIDSFLPDSGLPPLEYRSIEFEWTRMRTSGFYQPNSVVNYPDAAVPYTRCVEYKHFLNQRSDWTIIAKERTCAKGEPYYPVPTEANREIYRKYVALAESVGSVHFVGRLASYKYYNMDQAIRAALDYFREHLEPVLKPMTSSK